MAVFMSIFQDTTKYENNSTTQLLNIQPLHLNFTYELDKQSVCAIKLTNVSAHNPVAFMINAESPQRYWVHPSIGLIKPKSASVFTVKFKAPFLESAGMECKDKFLIQSRVVPLGTNQFDITPVMFAENSLTCIEKNMLWAVMFSRPHSPELNISKKLELIKAMVNNIKAEFNNSEAIDDQGHTTTQVNAKPSKTREEMSFCEYTRTYTWHLWLTMSITFITLILLATYFNVLSRFRVYCKPVQLDFIGSNPQLILQIDELDKQSVCAIKLTNVSAHNPVAFMINAESPQRYWVHPSIGLIKPKSASVFTVKFKAPFLESAGMECKDKFLIQSRVVPLGTNQFDITPVMFAENSLTCIEKNMLWAVMFSRPHSPELNISKKLELIKAMVNNIKAEFNNSEAIDDQGHTTTQVNAKPSKTREEMSFCEYTRTYTWHLWLTMSITFITLILVIRFVK
ncbi:hypothetical protein POM88_018648 [Heracleum sosnowskyi]|uniref:MSP domain-containing protein n=1 Tax=Heracleum sosnowskyi TaxID=360622 RepID=A0AAD8IRH3_9APIA|nr:hypothetical protein POM88_018648 [Heracleum sosnowskyi]